MKKVQLVRYLLLALLFLSVVALAWYWFSYRLAVILTLLSGAIAVGISILKNAGTLQDRTYLELADEYRIIIYKLCKDNPAFDEFRK